jgi:hypothetical protein
MTKEVGRNVSLLCMARDYQGRTLMVMSNVGNESYKNARTLWCE